MNEAILRDFFTGKVTVQELTRDLEGTIITKETITYFSITDMDSEFLVKSEHLIRACDAVLNDELGVDKLRAIGFCLEASDNFCWNSSTEDGNRVAAIASYWSSPEINYPITIENVVLFKELLIHGGDPFESAT